MGCTQSEHLCIGMSVREWKKASSAKQEKIWLRWKKIMRRLELRALQMMMWKVMKWMIIRFNIYESPIYVYAVIILFFLCNECYFSNYVLVPYYLIELIQFSSN